jgi:glycosyltransferase involved in cell wall biosynthesis
MNKDIWPPLLSVVIPTLNRPSLLRETLQRISSNYPVDDYRVEFIVVDNASDCHVNDIVSDLSGLFANRLGLIRFESQLEITDSFCRSVGCTNGRFIQIFGDDDLPLGLIGFRLVELLQISQIHLIYINRLIGDSELLNVNDLAHPSDVCKLPFKLSLFEFISCYTHWPGFITSLVFSRFAWESGMECCSTTYPGYSFLNVIYRSPITDEVLIIGEPSLIQRRGVQTWKKMWPLYWYQGMARLLADLDRDKISSGCLNNWLDNDIQFYNHIADLLLARSLPKIYKSSFWRELMVLFKGRDLLQYPIYIIRFLPPSSCRLILRLSPNRHKYGFTK